MTMTETEIKVEEELENQKSYEAFCCDQPEVEDFSDYYSLERDSERFINWDDDEYEYYEQQDKYLET